MKLDTFQGTGGALWSRSSHECPHSVQYYLDHFAVFGSPPYKTRPLTHIHTQTRLSQTLNPTRAFPRAPTTPTRRSVPPLKLGSMKPRATSVLTSRSRVRLAPRRTVHSQAWMFRSMTPMRVRGVASRRGLSRARFASSAPWRTRGAAFRGRSSFFRRRRA